MVRTAWALATAFAVALIVLAGGGRHGKHNVSRWLQLWLLNCGI